MALPGLKSRSPISTRKESARKCQSPSRSNKILREPQSEHVRCTPILLPQRASSSTKQQMPKPTMPTLSRSEEFLKKMKETMEKARKSAEKHTSCSLSNFSSRATGSMPRLPPPSQQPPKTPKITPTRPTLRVIRPHTELPEQQSKLGSQPRTVVEVVIPVKTQRSRTPERREAKQVEAWSERLRVSRQTENSLPVPTIEVLPPTDGEQDREEYAVENIAGEKIGEGDIHEYLVKWVGYDELDWVPASLCFCPNLIAEFRAAQRVARIAARQNGQEIEASRLDRLAEAAEVRAQRSQQNRRQYQQRDPKTGRYVSPTKSQPQNGTMAETDAGMGIEEDNSDGASVVFVTEKPIVPRDTRANTARLPSSRGSPIFWQTEQSEKSGETVWIRPKMEEVSPDPVGQLYRSVETVRNWVYGAAETTLKRSADIEEEERGTEDDEVAEVATAEVAGFLEEELTREVMLNAERVREIEMLDAERDRLATESQRRKDQDAAVEVLKLEEKDTTPKSHMPIRHKRSLRHSYANIKHERDEEVKCREGEHRRKTQNLLFKAAQKASGNPLLHNLLVLPSIEMYSSSMSLSSTSEDQDIFELRHARKREKSLLRKKAPSTLVRSEFRTQMGENWAKHLINQTRPDPEMSIEPEPTPQPVLHYEQVEDWMADVVAE